jgi:DNA-binding transcriptional LysR family regulator
MSQPLDSRQLKAFTVLSRTGSFTLAAKELFLSQSAVSHSMKALEEDVGCRLLDRLGKKVLLTQAGEQFLRHAERIIHEMEETRGSIEKLGKWGRGRIRVGASSMICQYLLPGVLREFRESFNKCFVTIETGETPVLLEMLRDNVIDLAIGLEPDHEDHFEFHPLFTDDLSFVVSPQHAWAVQGRVVREEIARQEAILFERNGFTARAIEEYFRKDDIVLNVTMHLSNMEAIKELVKLRLGITLAPPWVVRREFEEKSLVLLSLGKRKLKRNWGLSHWRGRRLSLAEETFVGLCRTAGRQVFIPPLLEVA